VAAILSAVESCRRLKVSLREAATLAEGVSLLACLTAKSDKPGSTADKYSGELKCSRYLAYVASFTPIASQP
jgi:hypothetical protein